VNLIHRPSRLRVFLVLGRVSNLPTVWSDCLAAWALAGGSAAATLVCVTISMSFLYVGGMFLNDAFDADFDRRHRRNRPIPSGAISEMAVWQWGFLWIILGLLGTAWIGMSPLIFGVSLSGCILTYNAVHKWTPLAPLLMGACRLGVYLTAASAAGAVDGEIVWKGAALALYIAGLSWVARKESGSAAVNYWPCVLLAAPIFMACCIDDGSSSGAAVLFSSVLVAWTAWALTRSIGPTRNIGLMISRLLAGIVLVDALAVARMGLPWMGLFPLWFALALLLQRFIPAT
jgi:4-hydroxybenzoate polyprenyltransferase